MSLWSVAALTAAAVAGLAGLLHLIPRLGAGGAAAGEWLSRAPGLDVVVSLFTWTPPVALGIAAGWRGVVGALVGQLAGLFVWLCAHEFVHRARGAARPRIVTFLNRTVGSINNHVALWATALAVPIFLLIRLAQLTIYPVLTRLVGLPRYRHADWINVSRQKFQGLVGHDLLWCLYCDWMTGVYALGAEILRNVESFWCPIRFASGQKCDNCKLDFPDIADGWVAHDGDMADVVALLERQYGAAATGGLPREQRHPWFGHPVRTTAVQQVR